MINFVLIDRPYAHVIETILAALPEFVDSDEFQELDEGARKLPSVVAGALGRFALKVHKADGDEGLRIRCFELIEKLSGSSDPEVENMVVLEILPRFSDAPEGRAMIPLLGEKSRELFERWVK